MAKRKPKRPGFVGQMILFRAVFIFGAIGAVILVIHPNYLLR